MERLVGVGAIDGGGGGQEGEKLVQDEGERERRNRTRRAMAAGLIDEVIKGVGLRMCVCVCLGG